MQVVNLTVKFKKKAILKNINLKITQPEIIGLVAPNGTGKTTLLRTIAGLIQPNEGSVSIEGTTVYEDRETYYKKMYYVESNHTLYSNLNGKDHLSYVKSVWKSSIDVEEVIRKLGISDYIHKPIKKLSLGMKQHILLAMCIVSDADVILLDEPMNGLDPTSMKVISKYIKEMKKNNKIFMISSHILSNIDTISDKVLFLKDGNIVCTIESQKDGESSENVYDKLYGTEEE
ncbi:ABC transporter ATP-binding protein [Marinilactibacillus kalidii]|uniref:ABC transporter ATP-binding protein n=1 Tax=Marinilactibacillus kalidii TaxID=2820274 RepID=UPI001ABE8651|nr:ABC transporter ATP-binding protein [Marinilactibacillus kalidii]